MKFILSHLFTSYQRSVLFNTGCVLHGVDDDDDYDYDYGKSQTQTDATQKPLPSSFIELDKNLQVLISRQSFSGSPDTAGSIRPVDPSRASRTSSQLMIHRPCLLRSRTRLHFLPWLASRYIEQVKNSGDFFTGRLGDVEFVVCRDESGKLQAFHNVCRHHATLVAYGSGRKSCFECPYHEFGLTPIKVATWGPFVLANMEPEVDSDAETVESEWLGSSSDVLIKYGVDSSLSFVCRREYTIECNWKVYCDYLDGGYHVPYAHKDLASGLKFDSYSTKVSIQECEAGSKEGGNDDRLGSKVLYAFVYPNFMINRYGPWLDTNLVIPLGPRKCQVIFDYFLEASVKDDKDYIERSLKDSDKVQIEDIMLSEGVQKGLESPGYNVGRYVPKFEEVMHHFHTLLHESMEK
ncbi:hypothetical protein ABKV19_025741 [Rosa sericea]